MSDVVTETTIIERLTKLGGSVVFRDTARFDVDGKHVEEHCVSIQFSMLAWDETVKRACLEIVDGTNWTARVNAEYGDMSDHVESFDGKVCVDLEHEKRVA